MNAVVSLMQALRTTQNSNSLAPIKLCITTFFDGKIRIVLLTRILDQKWKIISKLREVGLFNSHTVVKTVDELDGSEFDVVIVSLVRTKEAGILNGSSIVLHKKIHCNGLLKVALTRAKSALYILGNLGAIEKFGGDIGELAKYCQKKEFVSEILP